MISTRVIRYIGCDDPLCDEVWPPDGGDLGYHSIAAVNSAIRAWQAGWRRDPGTQRDYCERHAAPENRNAYGGYSGDSGYVVDRLADDRYERYVRGDFRGYGYDALD